MSPRTMTPAKDSEANEDPAWLTTTMKRRLESYAAALAQEQTLEQLRIRGLDRRPAIPASLWATLGLSAVGLIATAAVAFNLASEVPGLRTRIGTIEVGQARIETKVDGLSEGMQTLVRHANKAPRAPASAPTGGGD